MKSCGRLLSNASAKALGWWICKSRSDVGQEAEGPDLCAVSPPATRGQTQLALDVVLDAEDWPGGAWGAERPL